MKKDRIGIIDYGMGNLGSVSKAFHFLDFRAEIVTSWRDTVSCDKIVLPGVGAFDQAISTLKYLELDKVIREAVGQGKPFLGICLGMQLLFDESMENGCFEGLGILPGRIVRLTNVAKIPQIGWNSLNINKDDSILDGLGQESYVYFVHSYHLQTQADIVSATTYYGSEIQVAVQSGNIHALQFHPEKSGDVGLKILQNFGGL